jgi:hypothetical protein
MKKYFLGLFSLALAICFNLLQSNITIPKAETQNLQTTYDWYLVNASGQIINTTPVFDDMTKADVIGSQDCQDEVLPNCLYGTNGSVTLGQNISGQPAAQRIRDNF